MSFHRLAIALEGSHASVIGGAPAAAVGFAREVGVRAVDVGSVDRIVPAAELRPALIEAVERGIRRVLERDAAPVA